MSVKKLNSLDKIDDDIFNEISDFKNLIHDSEWYKNDETFPKFWNNLYYYIIQIAIKKGGLKVNDEVILSSENNLRVMNNNVNSNNKNKKKKKKKILNLRNLQIQWHLWYTSIAGRERKKIY